MTEFSLVCAGEQGQVRDGQSGVSVDVVSMLRCW